MRWFGKRRGKDGGNRHGQEHRAETLETRNRKPRVGWIPVVALAVLMAAVVAVPQSALADDHEPWQDEIDFELTEPVEGRRIFVEGLTVSDDRAAVTLSGRHGTGRPRPGLRRAGGHVAALLGLGNPDGGGAHRLLAPPPRTRAVLHRVVGRRPWTGRGADLRGSTASLPPAGRGGGALRPSRDLPGLDARSGQRSRRVRVRHAHRAPGRASDGCRARERHPDGPDGRPGDGHRGDGLRRHRSVERERPVRPQWRDAVHPACRRWSGHPRRERGREP